MERRDEESEDLKVGMCDKGGCVDGGCDEWGNVKGDGDDEGNEGNNSGDDEGWDERRLRGKTNEPHSSELNLRSWLGDPVCVFNVAFGDVGVGMFIGPWVLDPKGLLFMGSLRWAAKGSS